MMDECFHIAGIFFSLMQRLKTCSRILQLGSASFKCLYSTLSLPGAEFDMAINFLLICFADMGSRRVGSGLADGTLLRREFVNSSISTYLVSKVSEKYFSAFSLVPVYIVLLSLRICLASLFFEILYSVWRRQASMGLFRTLGRLVRGCLRLGRLAAGLGDLFLPLTVFDISFPLTTIASASSSQTLLKLSKSVADITLLDHDATNCDMFS